MIRPFELFCICNISAQDTIYIFLFAIVEDMLILVTVKPLVVRDTENGRILLNRELDFYRKWIV